MNAKEISEALFNWLNFEANISKERFSKMSAMDLLELLENHSEKTSAPTDNPFQLMVNKYGLFCGDEHLKTFSSKRVASEWASSLGRDYYARQLTADEYYARMKVIIGGKYGK